MWNKYAELSTDQKSYYFLCTGMINAMTKDRVENITMLLFIIYSLFHLGTAEKILLSWVAEGTFPSQTV